MAVNPELLIAAPMLQDYIVDKSTGQALAAGIIYVYEDASRTTYKNWYFQTKVGADYEYVQLPNPLTLSAAGTINDGNGNDVIPFFYPYDETTGDTQPYYIRVTNANGQEQFVRENFPYLPPVTRDTTIATNRNYLTNNVFWRFNGAADTSIDVSNETDFVLAPSQHDGFSMPDTRLQKSKTGATESITFTSFVPGDGDNDVLENDITPEWYVKYHCTAETTGELYKYIQIPISLHIKTLENVTATAVIHARCDSGTDEINLYINQFLGTGAAANPPIQINVEPIALTNTFQKYEIEFIFPTAALLSLSGAGDDALYLQIGYPLNSAFNIDIAKPAIYLNDTAPTNDFDTYDQIDTVINSPRTGDFRTSLNSFVPFGWVAANDGSIGSLASSASTRANVDTWPLYKLLWENVLDNWAPVSTGRGVSAYADYTANKTLTLTRNLGRVIAGINPLLAGSATFTVPDPTNDQLLFATAMTAYTTGTPVQVYNTGGALPAGLTANTVYFAIFVDSTHIKLATTIENAYANTPIDITDAGTGTQTITNALGAYTGESMHQLTIAEMPSHNHDIVIYQADSTTVNNRIGCGLTSSSVTNTDAIQNKGGDTPHNTIQPTTYANVFIKL